MIQIAARSSMPNFQIGFDLFIFEAEYDVNSISRLSLLSLVPVLKSKAIKAWRSGRLLLSPRQKTRSRFVPA